MSDQTASPMIFHIRPEGPSPTARPVEATISETGIPVETCDDVYRGLARILKKGRGAICAVVVCVDGLSESELEFFSIVSQGRGGAPVYVYGGPNSRTRVDRAIQLGASGEATQDVLHRITLERTTEPRAAARAPAEPSAVEPVTHEPPELIEAAPSEPQVEPAESPEPDMTEPATGKDDEPLESEPPRVPWVRYGDAPARRSPRELTPPAAKPGPAESKPSTKTYEPLVSEEELRALMDETDGPPVHEDNLPRNKPNRSPESSRDRPPFTSRSDVKGKGAVDERRNQR